MSFPGVDGPLSVAREPTLQHSCVRVVPAHRASSTTRKARIFDQQAVDADAEISALGKLKLAICAQTPTITTVLC
jgi:hypothetical protein